MKYAALALLFLPVAVDGAETDPANIPTTLFTVDASAPDSYLME